MQTFAWGHNLCDVTCDRKMYSTGRPCKPSACLTQAGVVDARGREPALSSLLLLLAGQTGSYLNLAPEVALSQPYNEKSDVRPPTPPPPRSGPTPEYLLFYPASLSPHTSPHSNPI